MHSYHWINVVATQKVALRWLRMQTIQFPRIVAVQKYRRDDVRAAWEVGHFATEEMDDEIFI